MSEELLLTAIGSLSSLLVAILCYFLKGIHDEMKSMNAQLIKVVSNQEWHYHKIIEMDGNLKVVTDRITSVENWKHSVKDQLIQGGV